MMPRRSILDRAFEAKIDEISGLRLYLDTRARYGQTQWTEFWLALIMLGFSIVLLLPTDTFSSPGYKVIATWVNEPTAGCIGVFTALGRHWMIRKNGSRHYTPVFRALGCVVGSFFWIALAIGFILAAPPLLGATVIFPIFALAELHSSMRAGADAIPQNSFGVRDFLVRRSERARRGEDLGRS